MHLTREDGTMKSEKNYHTGKQNACFVGSLTPLSQWLEGERKLLLEAASWFYIIVTEVGG